MPEERKSENRKKRVEVTNERESENRKKKTEMPDEDQEKKKRMVGEKIGTGIEAVGKTMRRMFQRLFGRWTSGKKADTTVYLAEDVLSENRKNRCFGAAVLLLAVGLLFTFIYSRYNEKKSLVTELPLAPFGEESEFHLQYHKGEETEPITILLPGKEPKEDEWDEVFDACYQKAKETWLGENESFDAVTRRVRFSSEDAYGIQYSFASSDEMVFSNRGNILTEITEPVEILVTVKASYKEKNRVFTLPLRLVPESDEKTEAEKIRQKILEAMDSSPLSDVVTLPTEWEGKTISFSRETSSVKGIAFFFFVGAALLLLYPQEKRKKAKKKRAGDLEQTYATMVMKLNLLIQADLSTESAWRRIVGEYETSVQEGRQRKNYAYEEMKIALRDMESGTSESSAYIRFGIRCESHPYIRLGNLLAQNLKLGIAGLKRALDEECHRALTERTQALLKKGELAGTKLLFPMVLLLGIVMASLILPVFLSF